MVLVLNYFILRHDESRKIHLYLPLRKLIWVTTSLPLLGFIFCIVWSMLYHFEETTITHCKVWNLFPSLSAAIGNHVTQYIVWGLCITLHTPVRLLFVILYYQYLSELLQPDRQFISKVICLTHFIENVSLLGLSYFTSSEFYNYHKVFFITFIVTSELYMVLICLVLKFARRKDRDPVRAFSLKIKSRLLIINFTSFLIAGYFFVRHNKHCEPGIYTLFALFEYIVVLTNIAFHLSALIDFRGDVVDLYIAGIDIR